MSFEKLSVPQTTVERSLSNANKFGALAHHGALHQLAPYTGEGEVFTEEQTAAYAFRKSDEAAVKYLNERISGKRNDKESTRPGLVALIRPQAKTRIEQVFALKEWGNLFGVEFEEVGETEGDNQLFIVRIPEGGYSELSRMTLEFTDIVEPVGEQWVQPTATASSTVRVGSIDVVTIAGLTGGEYWQNPFYNIDGTYRERANTPVDIA